MDHTKQPCEDRESAHQAEEVKVTPPGQFPCNVKGQTDREGRTQEEPVAGRPDQSVESTIELEHQGFALAQGANRSSCTLPPRANSARNIKSSDTSAEPASILATRDWLDFNLLATCS